MSAFDVVNGIDQVNKSGGGALAKWQQKLAFFQEQEAITADPNQRFELREMIAEAKQRIAELIAQETPPSQASDDREDVDFVLQIGERETADAPFPVNLLHSPAGSAQNLMTFPFAALELDNHLQNLTIALLRSQGTDRHLFPKEMDKVQQFGDKMFEMLFAGDIKDRYREASRRARDRGRSLPIKLCILNGELSTLPWEFLYDRERSDFLALSKLTPLVRYLKVPEPPRTFPVDLPLRILGVLSSPLNSNLSPLDLRHERQRVENAVSALRKSGVLDLHWLPRNTLGELQRALMNGPWHVFHFVGHGGFDNLTREGAIAIEDESGQPLLLTAPKLRSLLQDHLPLRLVVLNACDTAAGDGSTVFSSMAGALVRHGVPAVLAMQYPISDQAAIVFATHFYESLSKGLPVAQALTEGRKAIHLRKDNSLEWGTPVLMTSSTDGLLFQINTNTRKDRQQDETGLGETGLGETGLGETGLGETGLGETGLGETGLGETGLGEIGLGETGLGETGPDETVVSVIVEKADPLKSPLWDDVRYWKRSELPVRLLVACEDAEVERRLKSLSSQFDRPLPVFEELADSDHFKTNQSFLFEWRATTPSRLLAEADDILRQDQIRLIAIVSDALCSTSESGSVQPSELTRSLREKFFSQPHQCGLLALVPGAAHRVTDVDRTLSLASLNRLELRRNITKIADGLRLKTPPGPAVALAADEALSIRLAQTREEIAECLKLRFQVYDRMGYLEEQLESAERELDCYDINALHLVGCTREGDIVGTVRLILARRLGPNEKFDSVAGTAPWETIRAQADWVRQIARERGGILQNKLSKPPYFGTLPILQSTEFQDNFGEVMSDVEKSAELSRLVVAPRYRGAGLSKLLVRAVIAMALSLKTRLVLLECIPAHVGMYERLGFERIPGTHGRAQELDQVAVGMRFDASNHMSKARALADLDLQMIKRGFGKPESQMLFGAKHLCMCAQKACWANGRFEWALAASCPLHAIHQRD